MQLNTVNVFYKILLAYSQRLLEELRIRWNKATLSTLPDDFKGTLFRKKNQTVDYKLAKEEQSELVIRIIRLKTKSHEILATTRLILDRKQNSLKLLRKYLQKQNHKFKNFDFTKAAQLINKIWKKTMI